MSQSSASSRTDVYRAVTEEIIKQIEAGAGTYRMPWHHNGSPASRPRNAVMPTFYRGINVVQLWMAAITAGYPSGLWATYRQWRVANAQVRKGEHGTLIVFWKQLDAEHETYTQEGEGDANESPKRRMVARGFWVFNIAQVDGYRPFAVPELLESERIKRAEQFYARLDRVPARGVGAVLLGGLGRRVRRPRRAA